MPAHKGWQRTAGLVLFGAVVAIVTVGVSAALVVDGYRRERSAQVARVGDSARIDASTVEQLVRDRIVLLQVLRDSEAVRSGDPARMAARFALVDAVSVGFPGGIGWIDLTGRLRVLAGTTDVPEVSVADRDWFGAASAGRSYVGSAVVSRIGSMPTVTFAVPTVDDAGSPTGVLAAGILPETFAVGDGAVIDTVAGSARAASYLIDRSGALIPGALVEGAPRRLAPGSVPVGATGSGGRAEGVVDAWGRSNRVVAWEPVPTADWIAVRSYDRDALLEGAERKLLLSLGGLAVVGLGFEVAAFRFVVGLRRRERRALEAALAERHGRERAESLGAVLSALAGLRSLQDAARTVSDLGLPLFGCRGGIAMVDPDDPAYLVPVHTGPDETDGPPTAGLEVVPSTLLGDAVLGGRVVSAPGEAIDHRSATALGIARPPDGCWLVVPLIDGARTVGVVVAAFDRTGDCDQAARVGVELLAERVTNVLAAAAEREFEHRATMTFQRSLLPGEPASIEGISVRARYCPANQAFGVGGDWYETFVLGPHRLTVVVGDLVGHGIAAAAAMGRLATATRALAPAHTPVSLLHALDEFARHDDGVFAGSVACVAVDRDTAELECALAGHPPPIVVGHDGRVAPLAAPTGPLLALGEERRSARLALDDVRAVVLYTDGAVERRGEVLDDGIERLVTALRSASRTPGPLACDEVLEQCLPPCQHDDAVLVVIEFDRDRSPDAVLTCGSASST